MSPEEAIWNEPAVQVPAKPLTGRAASPSVACRQEDHEGCALCGEYTQAKAPAPTNQFPFAPNPIENQRVAAVTVPAPAPSAPEGKLTGLARNYELAVHQLEQQQKRLVAAQLTVESLQAAIKESEQQIETARLALADLILGKA